MSKEIEPHSKRLTKFTYEHGSTYQDDPENIPDSSKLLRRIPPCHIVWDGNRQEWRPSTAAFDDYPKGEPMSVRVRHLLESMGLTTSSVIADHQNFSLAQFQAGIARDKAQVVTWEEADGEPAHAVVAGKKTKGVKKHFVRNSDWVILDEATIANASKG